MLETIKKNLGYPYSKELEQSYKAYLVKRLYKPLLGLVFAILLLQSILLLIDFTAPDLIAPPEYITILTIIHLFFFIFTIVILCLAVLLRKEVLKYPNLYFVLVNTYAVGICIWGSTLAAYTDYSTIFFTAYACVVLVLAVVLVLKPWQAIILFACNCLYYIVLVLFVFPNHERIIENISGAILAAVLAILISIIIYALRTKSYYNRTKVKEQMEQINKINALLQERVHIDGLTGIRNRRFFDEVLPEKIEELQQSKAIVCGMMFDIDGFKEFNDRYGHQEGDFCLRKVATLVNNTLSAKDTYFVRYGGEEFFVLAAVPDTQSAAKLAERMRSTVENAYIENLSSERGCVTISIGVSLLQDDDILDTLTKRADDAVYQAKQQGRNQVAFYA